MLHILKSKPGANRARKRLGRGNGSTHGNFSGRGMKGQKARGSISPMFEGGQLALVKRMPALRGFKNRFRTEYQAVNLDALADLHTEEVTPQSLLDARIIRKKTLPVKILGKGDIKSPIRVTAHAFSKSAIEKIESAGGSVVICAFKQ